MFVLNGDNGMVSTPAGASFRVVRVWFSKTGRAKFISHLDLNRTMTRALRRAGLPIWYTEGFNKRPYLTFAAPLSLGYEGLRECMDIRLLEDWPPERIVERLNAAMPEGLAVVAAAPAVMKPGALTAARYRLTFACSVATLAAFAAQEVIEAEKFTKKKERKMIDLKPALANAPSPQAAGDECCTWELTLPCNSTDTVNPSLIAQALNAFAGREIACRVLRLELLGTDGAPFA